MLSDSVSAVRVKTMVVIRFIRSFRTLIYRNSISSRVLLFELFPLIIFLRIFFLEVIFHKIFDLMCRRILYLLKLSHCMNLVVFDIPLFSLISMILLSFFREKLPRLLDEYLFPDLWNFYIEASFPESLVKSADKFIACAKSKALQLQQVKEFDRFVVFVKLILFIDKIWFPFWLTIWRFLFTFTWRWLGVWLSSIGLLRLTLLFLY